ASYWAVRNMTSKIGMAIGMVVSASLLASAKDGVMSEELAMRLIFVFGAVMLVIGGISLMLYKEVKYRFNKEFYKFLRIQKESDALLEKINKLSASLKKEKEADKKADLTKEITKLKSLHKESIKEQEECLELSKKKIDASTKKEITHIQNKITHLNKGHHKNKEEKLIRFEKDIKTYNNIRSGMSIKEL
ncbi:MAG: hypothetical protein KAG04_01970, partial [Mycoplasmataceae bacterium]|nr:hypothetical protein [Mycoplasmataceae bacterium]